MYKNLEEPIEPLSIRIANVLTGIERLICWGFTIASCVYGLGFVISLFGVLTSDGERRGDYLHAAAEQAGAIFVFVIIILISSTIFQTIDYLITGRKRT